jgi:hypothetical protein
MGEEEWARPCPHSRARKVRVRCSPQPARVQAKFHSVAETVQMTILRFQRTHFVFMSNPYYFYRQLEANFWDLLCGGNNSDIGSSLSLMKTNVATESSSSSHLARRLFGHHLPNRTKSEAYNCFFSHHQCV